MLKYIQPLGHGLSLLQIFFKGKLGEEDFNASLIYFGLKRVLIEPVEIEVKVLATLSIFADSQEVVTLAHPGLVVVFQEDFLFEFFLAVGVAAFVPKLTLAQHLEVLAHFCLVFGILPEDLFFIVLFGQSYIRRCSPLLFVRISHCLLLFPALELFRRSLTFVTPCILFESFQLLQAQIFVITEYGS